jgi:nitrogen fixation protein FixH
MNASPREARLTGLHVASMFAMFFVIVASVNGYMMKQAISTMPGLDARNGYDESQKYNALIRRSEAQAERHWTPTASVVSAAGRTLVTIDFSDGPEQARRPLAVTARFEHPATTAADRKLAPAVMQGRYSAALDGELKGLWTLVIEARDPASGDILFQSRNRLTIRG